ncbi:MAG: lipid-A-disaccharide synthase, partial [Afipia sp.]|nr:lipid-A-disaccharide synthase [Afipia sp.]
MSTSPPHAEAPRTIFLIAAEESGDRLGAGLMTALRERLGPAVRLVGIGGRHMAEQGLTSLVSVDGLSIIGFASI